VIFDAVAFAIQAFGELGFTFGTRPSRTGIETIVDAIAFGIEMIIDPVASGIQPIVDSVPSCVETVIDTIASVIQPPVDAIAAPVVEAILGKSRYCTTKSQHTKSYYDCLFHVFASPSYLNRIL
jgi:phage-related protein